MLKAIMNLFIKKKLDSTEEVNKISSNNVLADSVFYCDFGDCKERATQGYRYQGTVEYLYRCKKHLR